MFLVWATAFAVEPDERVSEYYARRLRHNAELVDDWTVLRGGYALAARDFGLEVGDLPGLKRMRTHRDLWLGVSGAVTAAGLGWLGLMTLPSVLGRDDTVAPLFAMLSVPVVLAAPIVSIHLSSRPNRAPVSAFYERPDAEGLLDRYNGALARDLSLDPAALAEP